MRVVQAVSSLEVNKVLEGNVAMLSLSIFSSYQKGLKTKSIYASNVGLI